MQSDNIYAAIHSCLSTKHPEIAAEFMARFPPSAAFSLSPMQQLASVNSFWRIILGRLPVDTINARDSLVNDVSFSTWMRDFQKYVLPTLVSNVRSLNSR